MEEIEPFKPKEKRKYIKRKIEPRKEMESRAMESYMIKHGLPGTVFYSLLPDKDITARATYYNSKVLTERVIVISDKNSTKPKAECLTKVTILPLLVSISTPQSVKPNILRRVVDYFKKLIKKFNDTRRISTGNK